jgi:Uma2 family endonuclease
MAPLTAEERLTMPASVYLALERESELKHEYINGVAYAMAGASREHNAIAANLVIALGTRLRGKPCRPVGSDQRLHVVATGAYFYPDVMVVCGGSETHAADPMSITNPRVVIEILSPSTADLDRGAKWDHYRRVPSLECYVVVHQAERRLEVRVPDGQGGWQTREQREGSLEIACVDVAIPLEDVYDLGNL